MSKFHIKQRWGRHIGLGSPHVRRLYQRAFWMNGAAWGGLSSLAFIAPLSLLATAPAVAQSMASSATPGSVETVVVSGLRGGQEQSIEITRSAVNIVSAISADDLGKFSDTNVADALSRLPGISVVNNQETGEGEFVTIRGLDSTFSAYQVNGIRVANTDPSSRAISLNVLPPNGMQSVQVSKTSTPDMDGDAIGGTINFVTPTAFDYSKPVGRILANYGLNSRALDQNENPDDYGLQLDFGRQFGPNNRLGFFVTGYYKLSHYISEETENDGEWEPYQYRANSEETISSTSMLLPGIDLDYRRIRQTRWGGNFSLDYREENQTLYLRGQFARFDRIEGHNYFTVKNRKTARLKQVDSSDTSLAGPDNSVVSVDANGVRTYSYTTSQIVDKNGDGVITDADATSSSYWSLIGKSGTWSPSAYYVERSFESDNQVSQLGTVDIGGSSHFDRLHLTYGLSYSFGKIGNPDDYYVDYKSSASAAVFNSTGVTFTSNDPRFPHWQLPAYAQYTTSDNSLLLANGASHSRSMTSSSRYNAKMDARYDAGGIYGLDFVQAGLKYQSSHRSHDETRLFDGDLPYATLADANSLIQRNVDSILGGEYAFGATFNMAAVKKAIDAMGTQSFSDDDQNGSDSKNGEAIYAGYGLANFKFGSAEVITGVRVEATDVDNTYWVTDDDSSANGWGHSHASYTEVLPSITVNYRPGEFAVYRAAVWTSFSRPQYSYISGGESITRDAAGNITAISRGNPDLKPAEAVNFDLSAEYYLNKTSMFSVGAFYKMINNFIFTNGNQVDATTPEGTIDVTQPQNGKDAKVYGLEFNLAKTFEELPSPLDGFGFFANFTLQNSAADTGQAYREGKEIPLINTSKYLFNLALDYQKYGFEARISYTYRSKFIEDLRDNAIDKWVQPNENLNFHSRYTFSDGVAVDFDVSNILDSWSYYTTKGSNPSYQKDYMESGRTYMLKAAYSY